MSRATYDAMELIRQVFGGLFADDLEEWRSGREARLITTDPTILSSVVRPVVGTVPGDGGVPWGLATIRSIKISNSSSAPALATISLRCGQNYRKVGSITVHPGDEEMFNLGLILRRGETLCASASVAGVLSLRVRAQLGATR